MSVEVMTWSMQDGLGQEASARPLVEHVLAQVPDVAVFPHAYLEEKHDDQVLDFVTEEFDAAGYRVVRGPYDDDDERVDRHGLFAIVRHELSDDRGGLIRLAGRNAIALAVFDEDQDTKVGFVGVHFDDRRESQRVAQVDSLVGQVAPNRPLAIAGTMGTMHDGFRAKALRAIQPIAERMPNSEPGQPTSRAARIGSVATRMSGMARGHASRRLEAAGFQDADEGHHGTTPDWAPVLPFDRIMHSDAVRTLDFSVLPRTGLTNHRAIRASLQVKN